MSTRLGLPGMRRASFLCLALLCLASGAHAAVLCGTVRDAATGGPVARAGVFLRLPAGAYTGLHGATDAAGAFCVNGVPAGTYDLEIRRDDYLVAYRRNVTVTEGSVGVEFEVGDAPAALKPPFPNPARDAVTFAFRLEAPGPARLTVHDVRGRLVFGWASPELREGDHEQTWTFADAGGRPVAPGLYFVRLAAGSFSRVRTLIHLP